jgi:hypothetical protein
MEYMKQGESSIPSNVKPAKTKYTNPGQKKMPWKSEGMSDTIHYIGWAENTVCIKTMCRTNFLCDWSINSSTDK